MEIVIFIPNKHLVFLVVFLTNYTENFICNIQTLVFIVETALFLIQRGEGGTINGRQLNVTYTVLRTKKNNRKNILLTKTYKV